MALEMLEVDIAECIIRKKSGGIGDDEKSVFQLPYKV